MPRLLFLLRSQCCLRSKIRWMQQKIKIASASSFADSNFWFSTYTVYIFPDICMIGEDDSCVGSLEKMTLLLKNSSKRVFLSWPCMFFKVLIATSGTWFLTSWYSRKIYKNFRKYIIQITPFLVKRAGQFLFSVTILGADLISLDRRDCVLHQCSSFQTFWSSICIAS